MSKTVFLFVVGFMVCGCARQPEWQVFCTNDGIVRVNTTTYAVQGFKRGEGWVEVPGKQD